MERLTKRSTSVQNEEKICCTHFDSKVCWDYTGQCSDGCPFEEQAWSRLAAYEDTGLEPEEIAPVMQLAEKMNVVDLVRENLRISNRLRHTKVELDRLKTIDKAQDEGRVVVFPCRIGDWLYYILGAKVRKAKVEEIQCSATKCTPQFDITVFAWDFAAKEQLTYRPTRDSWTDNSKGFVPVFLTRAEAEAALGGGGDG